MSDELICCAAPRSLPPDQQAQAVKAAVANNPANLPPQGVAMAAAALGGGPPAPDHLAVLVSRWWGAGGVQLRVGFLERVSRDLAERILAYANVWGQFANVRFELVDSPSQAHVRITLRQAGYWSYLGTDCLRISAGQPTMCLQGWSMGHPESEWKRVIYHEFGHALGFPHEHARPDMIQLLDPGRTVSFYMQTQGWSAAMVQAQLLTPPPESDLWSPYLSDEHSIMCYQIPGQCTRSGQPIPGGTDIDYADQQVVARLYPPSGQAPAPPVETA